MTISLYDLSVPTFLQTMSAVAGFLDRATRHCAETGADPDDFVDARLFDDMAPFHFQIEALTHHAVWGVKAVTTGTFDPPPLRGPIPFAELRAMVGKAEAALQAFTPDEINSWSGKDLDIEVYRPVDEENASTSAWAPRTLAFTPETFLLSYSRPNFYFHAVTAYDILRTRGVPIGKGDYEGRLRTRSG
ncbi:DUF1993 domain-containing protein [Sphingomonas gilva]|uniref:DUF1993 domain-containing protein n=1 Tax=Sphingomonas gilva TaxID=2305907 RepID=A0A396RSI7_9SPHN|nr:DUF1993 domain-containing protein [Sphingomonas gilva]RHW18322.1 DUF1993 domain-containing protein [Sphingomonas gilva]